MPFKLSSTAINLANQINKQVQLIVEIEGIDTKFGAIPVEKKFRLDDGNRYDTGLRYDSNIIDDAALPIIDLNSSTRSISQQINIDKGATTSLSTMSIAFVDKDSQFSQLIAYNNSGELLGKKIVCYLNFKGGAHPEDSYPFFRGFVSGYNYKHGLIVLDISSPEKLKDQTLITIAKTKLTSAINNSQTTIQVESTSQFLQAGNGLLTYIRIDDEIMLISGVNSATQFTVARAQLNTIANAHDINTDCESYYRLSGNPIELALKLLLSNEGNTYGTIQANLFGFNTPDGSTLFANSLIYEGVNFQDFYGLVEGDLINISGSTSNDGSCTIIGFDTFQDLTIIYVDKIINTESVTGVTIEYKSKYNVLSFGLGLESSEVDVDEFENYLSTQASTFVDYDFKITEDKKGKDFIDTELFFPQGLYAIPRRARTSLKLTQPPITSSITASITPSTCLNAEKLVLKRSSDQYRYNEIIYTYDIDSIDDKFLRRDILISASSKARVKAGVKQLKIESNGLRQNNDTTQMVQRISRRFNDRYKFAASTVSSVEVGYGFGYALEIGDVLPFGGFKINSPETGARGLDTALYEVINKTLDISSAKVKLDLLETGFSLQNRFVVIGLASQVVAGSTASEILVASVWPVSEYAFEGDKWIEFKGARVQVRSKDWADYEIATIDGISPINRNRIILKSSLGFTPNENHIIEFVDYDDSSAAIDADYKLKFLHINSTLKITGVINNKVFTVDDATKIVVGSYIYVHSPDYTRDSEGEERFVESVLGNTITLDANLSFLPLINDLVESMNYLDNGKAYSFI